MRALAFVLILSTAGPCSKPEPQPTPTPSASTTPAPGAACVMPSLDTAGYEPGKSVYYAAISDAESSVIARNPARFNAEGAKLADATSSAWFSGEIVRVLQSYGYCSGMRDEWMLVAPTALGPFEQHRILAGDKIIKGEATPVACSYEDGYADGVNTFFKCPGSFVGLLVLEPGGGE